MKIEIPRFLIAENRMDDPNHEFIIHTQYPRCIMKFSGWSYWEGLQIEWVEPDFIPEKNTTILADLVNEAGQFYIDDEKHFEEFNK